ncbi:MAG: BrnT family toxin [Planctomycetes bacterium]|nr:BrnT family toxin [Planctomycetota bacterium]
MSHENRKLLWPQDRVEHISEHGVTPAEVEQACFGDALVQRAKSKGENPVYYVRGQTESGRFLLSVVIQFPDRKGYPVTAREMTRKEKRRYRKWKNR